MKKILYIILLVFLLFSLSCETDNSPTGGGNEQAGKIPLDISLEPLLEMDVTITQALVSLSKDEVTINQNLLISATSASGTITDLAPGIWNLQVDLFSNDYILAHGETQVEVLPGQTSQVNLTLVLNDISGSIEITVDWEINEPLPQRFLFLGNSYTYYNDGLAYMFRSVAQSYPEDLNIEVESITGGGLTLQNHFQNATTQEAILNGNWDIVVLQEQSQMPILDTENFLTYASKLDSLIDLSGAQTCFFMTWAREYDQSQIEGLSSAYLQAGELLDALVVPVGQVFNYVYEDNDEINLYMGDGSHPSIQGTYLASLCFYQEIFNSEAENVTYLPAEITIAEGQYLRTSVSNWYQGIRK